MKKTLKNNGEGLRPLTSNKWTEERDAEFEAFMEGYYAKIDAKLNASIKQFEQRFGQQNVTNGTNMTPKKD